MNEKQITEDKIKSILNELAVKKHFFVSELHFQTEFIIEAATQLKGCKFYPEYKPREDKRPDEYGDDVFFDLLIVTKDKEKVLIEFKYLTAEYSEDIKKDMITLSVKDQQARDIRRYDCWKDIYRIEQYVESKDTDISYGFFILITNDDNYWDINKTKKDTNDKAFYINDGDHNDKTKSWGSKTGDGTKKGREKPIENNRPYRFKYNPFYEGKSNEKNRIFKSLIVPVFKS